MCTNVLLLIKSTNLTMAQNILSSAYCLCLFLESLNVWCYKKLLQKNPISECVKAHVRVFMPQSYFITPWCNYRDKVYLHQLCNDSDRKGSDYTIGISYEEHGYLKNKEKVTTISICFHLADSQSPEFNSLCPTVDFCVSSHKVSLGDVIR